jgi:hypothetical protein
MFRTEVVERNEAHSFYVQRTFSVNHAAVEIITQRMHHVSVCFYLLELPFGFYVHSLEQKDSALCHEVFRRILQSTIAKFKMFFCPILRLL